MSIDTVRIGDIEIGGGRPVICVPVTGRGFEEIKQRTREAVSSGADLAEWRADWYEGVFEGGRLEETLDYLHGALSGMPLLVTFRTRTEGGEAEAETGEYRDFLERVIISGRASMVDAELFMGRDLLTDICETAHRHGVYVVASNHDFHATPPEDEIINRLCAMQECGADLLKIAVMPRNTQDVLRLLSATSRMRDEYAVKPLITMSMGRLGMVSRLTGEVFGSAVTFGSAGTASAPGQTGVSELRDVLDVIHRNYQ